MKYTREISVAGLLLALLLTLAWRAPAFFDRAPLLSLLAREAPALMVVGGMAVVIICRQIDISVGSIFALAGVTAGLIAAHNITPVVAVVGAIGLGVLLGAVNGALVAGLRLPSIVVTLATLVAWREGLRWWREGQYIDLPAGVQWLGLTQTQGQLLLIAIAGSGFAWVGWALRKWTVGRWLYAVGSNEEAARLAGIPSRWITFGAFVAMGGLTGAAAAMNMLQSPQVDPNSGTGLELHAIAAVVIGGVAITGGRGNVWGAAAGFGLLMCLSPALTYLHIEAYWDRALEGAIILLAVLADGLRKSRHRDRSGAAARAAPPPK